MIEIEPGIFLPTKEWTVTDEWSWCVSNRGYNLITNRNTGVVLFAYADNRNGVNFAREHFNVDTYVIGGINAVDYSLYPRYYPVED